jgi:acyl-CoA thioesterase
MNEDEFEDELEDEKGGIEIRTHGRINTSLCGVATLLNDNYAEVTLETTEDMSVDELGLVHGGFTFGAADHAAMLAINDPYVVLIGAQTRFLAPVKTGETLIFKASAVHKVTKRRDVKVEGFVGQIKVFEGEFTTVVMDQHILKTKFKTS